VRPVLGGSTDGGHFQIYQDAPRAMRIAVAADGVHSRDRRSGSLFKPRLGTRWRSNCRAGRSEANGLQIALIDHLVNGFRPGASIYCLLGSSASRDPAVL